MTAERARARPDAQEDVVRLLSDPATFGPGVEKVETVETHVSRLFLGADRVLKLKRAVVFPYLDFSDPESRRRACEAEVRINRRTAPTIYRGVVAVTREASGALALGGTGEPMDWVVDMTRFDEATLFDRLAQKGALGRAIMEDLADAIAQFHRDAEARTEAGGSAGIAMILDSNARCFEQWGEGVFEAGEGAALTRSSRDALAALGPLPDRRRDGGRVRHCHGDLHLRNICLVGGRPTLFDAIEFDEAFATIDVLYDLAFLLMDLEHRGLRRLASIVLNRYLDVTGDGAGEWDGLRMVPLFLSMRAAVRAHVDAAQAGALAEKDAAAAQAAEAREYLRMAREYLAPVAPRLVAVGGLSGSGKSRLARELARHIGAAPGARVVRTDSIRKRLAGVPLTERLDEAGYAPEMTARTYRAMREEAATALAAGRAAIADAVFAGPEERRAIEDVARDAGVPFIGLWLEAPPEVMARRVTARQRNVSDADARVLERQLGYDTGAIEWTRIDTSGPRGKTLEVGLGALKAR